MNMTGDGISTSIRGLIEEIDRYLAAIEAAAPVREGLSRFAHRPTGHVIANPYPACGGLDEALAAISGVAALMRSIKQARPHLNWVTYDSYPRDLIGERFPKAHAFTTLVGQGGFIGADDFELGLFLIAPRTLYRDHRHRAPELYVPLTGPHDWRFGVDDAWRSYPAHHPVWNPPDAAHAMCVSGTPFFCIYGWTADVNLPPEVIPASDWHEIEAHL